MAIDYDLSPAELEAPPRTYTCTNAVCGAFWGHPVPELVECPDCHQKLCPECPQKVCESCDRKHCWGHMKTANGYSFCPECLATGCCDRCNEMGQLELAEAEDRSVGYNEAAFLCERCRRGN